jgi:parvulin-like peptidyl-prolyl isomerase
MPLTTLLRATAVAALFGIVAFATPAQDQNTDDVAAAARKAREQQKTAPKPKKVLTNDDIPSAPVDNKAGDSGAKADGQGPAATDKPVDPNGEAAWRKRFQQLHDKISTAQGELDVLQRELDKDRLQYYSDPQKALMQQHDRSDVNDHTAKIDAKKKEIEALNQQLSDLEDQLRKSGGDPGWAR